MTVDLCLFIFSCSSSCSIFIHFFSDTCSHTREVKCATEKNPTMLVHLYLSLDIICLLKLAVFLELCSQKNSHYLEQIFVYIFMANVGYCLYIFVYEYRCNVMRSQFVKMFGDWQHFKGSLTQNILTISEQQNLEICSCVMKDLCKPFCGQEETNHINYIYIFVQVA